MTQLCNLPNPNDKTRLCTKPEGHAGRCHDATGTWRNPSRHHGGAYDIATASRVIEYLEQREQAYAVNHKWTPEQGAIFISLRDIQRALHRQADLMATIFDMVRQGLLVEDGKGSKGSPRQLALTLVGRQTRRNLRSDLLEAYSISPDIWSEFFSKVKSRGRVVVSELTKLLKSYLPENDSVAKSVTE